MFFVVNYIIFNLILIQNLRGRGLSNNAKINIPKERIASNKWTSNN